MWSPTTDFSLLADYYDIEIEDQIWDEDVQRLVDEEFYLRQAGETGPTVGRITRDRRGLIADYVQTYENIDTVETNGFDAEVNYSFSVRQVGDFSMTLRWTHVFEYNKDYKDGQGVVDWAGRVGFPQDRGQFAINWNLGDYGATVIGNYIADQHGNDQWGEFGGSGDEQERLASFTTWDVQMSYSTPWNGKVTLGARNVLDRDPPQFRDGTGYSIRQHEIYGRVPYLRLEQDF